MILGILQGLFKDKQDIRRRQPTKFALLGDIGGTNTRLQLVSFQKHSQEPEEILLKVFPSQNFISLSQVLQLFLSDVNQDQYPEIAVIGIAGPVEENFSGKVTNVNWPYINGKDIQEEFSLEKFVLLNDFESIGYAMLKLRPNQLIQINDCQRADDKIISVIGPGTGLGISMLVPTVRQDEIKYYVHPGEGGHASFGPVSKEQQEYQQFLQKELDSPTISAEQAFAGPAIQYIYDFLKSKKQNLESQIEKSIPRQEITNYQILQWGIHHKDELCTQVLDFFLSLLASECGNIAVRTLSFKGVYIVGGLTQSLTQYIMSNKEELFLNHFYNKGKMTQLLNRVPLYIVQEVELGLLGAFVTAQRKLFDL